MPVCTVDPKSGAIQYTPTPEEREMLELKRLVKALKREVAELTERVERLEKDRV